ncbi:MAG TPA: hypothetical protein VM099_16130 [Gemmatimonadaceae bacterium]|nr:hypothetical protein [Gemmatimonadaceae bacterium]
MLSILAAVLITAQQSPVIEVRHGYWLTGQEFVSGSRYIVDGKIIHRRPARVDSILDVHNGYIVPPFGEAHNHNIDYAGPERTAQLIDKYLRDGVFYIKNPGNLPRGRDSLVAYRLINHPQTVDAVFSNGLLIPTGGHPTDLWKRNVARGGMTQADGDGGFLWIIDTAADLAAKWPRILAGKPDFIKTVLAYSEEYERRRQDSAYENWRGLNPALLPDIVRRAHAAKLRVSTHVETAADFHNAVIAGVDEINHTPGFRGDEKAQLPNPAIFEINKDDAALAAKNRIIVVTTLGGISSVLPTGVDSLRRRAFDNLARKNLRTLKSAGVELALGSDGYRDDSVGEATYLSSLGVFTDMELLSLWSQVTPRAIFPQRKVGCLDEGCEASFLVLGDFPGKGFRVLRDIKLRVKNGRVLR